MSQPEKQELSNEVTDEGIVIEVKPLQKENVLLVDYQYYTLQTVEKWLYGFYIDTNWQRFNVFNFRLHYKLPNSVWTGTFQPNSKCDKQKISNDILKG